jgi:hypothetical protein
VEDFGSQAHCCCAIFVMHLGTCWLPGMAVSHGTPLLLPVAEESIPQQLSQSVNAARLLLDTLTIPSTTPMQQLTKQTAFQDWRLEKCQESGKDWEKYFYYGMAPKLEPLSIAPAMGAISKIPTW